MAVDSSLVRIHPAFLWGWLFLIVSLPARFAIGQTPPGAG